MLDGTQFFLEVDVEGRSSHVFEGFLVILEILEPLVDGFGLGCLEHGSAAEQLAGGTGAAAATGWTGGCGAQRLARTHGGACGV